MTVLARNRHRRTAVMLAINLLAIVALGGMGYAGYKALRRYEGGKRVDRQEVPLSPTPVGMLATVDAQDRLTTVTIMVLTPEAQGFKGGSIVSVPVSADTAFGVDGQRIPLTQVYAEGGVDGLVSGVESVLAITLDVWEVATPAQAEPLFTAITPFTATFPQDVDGGTLTAPELLYPAGEAGLSAAQVVAVLNTRVEGATDASRRANVLALWSAVSTAVGSGRTQVANVEPVVTGPFVSPVGDLADLMARLFAGPVASRGVAATALAPGEAPAGVDAEALDFADAVMVFGAVAPSAMSATRDALVYRIEAPPGYDAQVKWAVTLVLYFGFNVQSVYVSASVPSHSYTEIEIYDERSQDQAASANDLFGEYRFVEPAYRIEGVEVVMRLGTDFLTGTGGVASGDTLPTTTTSTTIG